MAVERDQNRDDEEEEPRIPVFTVLKNGAILKNIFIVNNTRTPSSSSQLNPLLGNQDQQKEEILIIGRHPDCNVMLTHPSISRFHLKIFSEPSLQKLSVMDLSSVHGTWISEKKIAPWERVDLNEGDSLRIGGSSRVYRLHWIPLSKAYNFDIPYASALDEPIEDEEDVTYAEPCLDENSLPIENEPVEEAQEEESEVDCSLFRGFPETQPLNLFVDFTTSLYSECLGVTVKEIQSASSIPESPVYSVFYDSDDGSESQAQCAKEIHCENGIFESELEYPEFPIQSVVSDALVSPYNGSESQIQWAKEIHCDNGIFESENLAFKIQSVVSDTPVSAYDGSESQTQCAMEIHCDNGIFESENVAFKIQSVVSDAPVSPYNGSESQIQCAEEIHRDNGIFESENLEFQIQRAVSDTPVSQYDGSESQTQCAKGIHCDSGIFGSESENLALPIQRVVSDLTVIAYDGSECRTQCSKEIHCDNGVFGSESENLALYEDSNRREEHSYAERLAETEDQNVAAEEHHERDESVNSSFPFTEVDSEIDDEKENRTPQKSIFESSESSNLETNGKASVRSEKSSLGSIWLRRGKPASAVQLRTRKNIEDELDAQENREGKLISKYNDQDIFTPDKENLTPNTFLVKSLTKNGKLRIGNENKSITKKTVACLNGEEEEEKIFNPDKENFTPNSILLKSFKSSNRSRSSPLKAVRSATMQQNENSVAYPLKENNQLGILRELKPVTKTTSEKQKRLEREVLLNRGRRERVPFQCLVAGNASSETPEIVEKNIVKLHPKNSVQESKREWKMVTDITTLLNEESRKKLQLFGGIRRTRLIIPRMVMKELDCLSKRGSFFRRKTEASLVLEWIEQCLVEKASWIHVQSLTDDTRLTAPTPPAFPRSSFSFESSMEIVSPTTEDHILECVLSYRKAKSNEQLVLLSEDITLKVKAIAEGLMCETMKDFWESLVNPFSERFLWGDSLARGQTWSAMDDESFRENYRFYDRRPSKKLLEGKSVKGLKLILLHNSHYGQRTPTS